MIKKGEINNIIQKKKLKYEQPLKRHNILW